jgi:hypothetical protein
MKTYTFYIYRNTFLPGGSDEKPDVRRIMCKDPYEQAQKLCKGAIGKVEWDEAPR